MRFIKKIVERGNITIPSDVREALEIDEGDIVEFEVVSIVKKTGMPAASSAEDESPRWSSKSSSRPSTTETLIPRGSTQ